MIIVAFYKAPGNFFDKLIRLWPLSRGKYSHTEIIFPDGLWWSSSPRDGGVRYKPISADPKIWDLKRIPTSKSIESEVRGWCNKQLGKRYDWLGILFSQIFPLDIDDKKRYFCSESNVDALKVAGMFNGVHSNTIDPNKLWDMLTEMGF